MPKVILIRNDGSRLEATPEQADRLALLGYRRETDEEHTDVLKSEAKSEFYEGADQQALAGLEGFGSGLTFGGTDYLFGTDGTKERAAYNPGTRMGTEILGALVPLILSGGESAVATGARLAETANAAAEVARAGSAVSKAARFAPTSLLSDAARAIAPGKAGSLTKAVTAGALEGSVYGGAGAADHAYLDGEPITAEAVLHGMKWGAVIGGALSTVGHGIEAAGKGAAEAEAKAVAQAAKKAEPEIPVGALKTSGEAPYQALRGELKAVQQASKDATATADASIGRNLDNLLAKGETSDLALFNHSEKEFVGAIREAKSLYGKVTKAVNAGQFEAAETAAAAYTSHLTDIAKRMGVDVPSPAGALKDLITTRSVAKELAKLPDTVEAFASMNPSKFERVSAALEQAKGMAIPNSQAVKASADEFSKALGVQTGSELRATWKAARDMYRREGKVPRQAKPQAEEPSFARKAAGVALGGKAYVAARAAGIGRVGAYSAYAAVKNIVTSSGKKLAGVRAATLGRLRKAAAEYAPGVGRNVKHKASTAALGVDLFGKEDRTTTDRRELAKRRVEDVAKFAPVAGDTIFRAVEPLSLSQPNLAPAMHASALNAFRALQAMAPRDSGVISGLKSLWKPSDVHAMIFAKQLAVFHDPVGEAENMLRTGQFDPIKVKALRDMAPAIWQDVRVALLERITQPGVVEKMTYNDQVGLSTMLDIAIHSSMRPENIATSQQMFVDRNQPLTANPRMGQAGPGTMPNASDNVNSTQSQKSTER